MCDMSFFTLKIKNSTTKTHNQMFNDTTIKSNYFEQLKLLLR